MDRRSFYCQKTNGQKTFRRRNLVLIQLLAHLQKLSSYFKSKPSVNGLVQILFIHQSLPNYRLCPKIYSELQNQAKEPSKDRSTGRSRNRGSKVDVDQVCQREAFSPEILNIEAGKPIGIKSRLISLTPFLDESHTPSWRENWWCCHSLRCQTLNYHPSRPSV